MRWEELLERAIGSAGAFLDRPAWQAWVVVTILLLIGEAFTAGFFLAALTPGTVLAAWLAAIGGGVKLQAFGFSVGTLAGLFALRPILLQRALDKGGPTNVDALIGQRCHVVEAIPAGGVGRVRVGAEEWRATCSDDVPAGADADVLGIEGNTLRVRRTPRPANTEGGA